jgi:hypothetical protein
MIGGAQLREVAMTKTVIFLLIMLSLPAVLFSQTPGSAPASTEQEGKEIGGYQVQQSIEFGYRFTDVNGSNQVYNTFINQHQGPRLLEQTLNMYSLNHSGLAFDRLSVNTFGWGGDPENAARLHVSKNLWYDFALSLSTRPQLLRLQFAGQPFESPRLNPQYSGAFLSTPDADRAPHVRCKSHPIA